MATPQDGLRKHERDNANLALFNWNKRVVSENKVHTKLNLDFRVPGDIDWRNLICNKPNNHKPAYNPNFEHDAIRRDNGFSLKEADGMLYNQRVSSEQLPRTKFMFPQTTYQELGWVSSQGMGKPVITGMYNYRPTKNPVYSTGPEDHHLGFVTSVGDPCCASRPRKKKKKRRSKSSDASAREADAASDAGSQSGSSLLGSLGMPREKKVRKSESMPALVEIVEDLPEMTRQERAAKKAQVAGQAARLHTHALKKAVQRMDELRPPPNFASKWYKPLTTSDVSEYSSAYLHCCGCSPFDKNQLMFSR